MQDTSKELWVGRVRHNTRIYFIYKKELVEYSEVLKFSSNKKLVLESMQKAIFWNFLTLFEE